MRVPSRTPLASLRLSSGRGPRKARPHLLAALPALLLLGAPLLESFAAPARGHIRGARGRGRKDGPRSGALAALAGDTAEKVVNGLDVLEEMHRLNATVFVYKDRRKTSKQEEMFAAKIKPAGQEDTRLFIKGPLMPTRKEAKVAAAQMALNTPGLRRLLEKSAAEGQNLPQASRAIPLQALEIGQSFEGTVTTFLPGKGVFVDIGAEKIGYMQAAEFTDGFPMDLSGLQVGCEVKVRILKVANESLWVTRRSGDLSRPTARVAFVNGFPRFAEIPTSHWLEAEVTTMTTFACFLLVSLPDGSAFATAALEKGDFADGIAEGLALGSKLQVRIKKLDMEKQHMFVTTKREVPTAPQAG